MDLRLPIHAYFATPAALRRANLFLSPKPELVAPLLISASIKKTKRSWPSLRKKLHGRVWREVKARGVALALSKICPRVGAAERSEATRGSTAGERAILAGGKRRESPSGSPVLNSGSWPYKPREASSFSRATPGTASPLPSGQMPAGRSSLWSDKRARLPSLLLQQLLLFLLLLLLQHG